MKHSNDSLKGSFWHNLLRSSPTIVSWRPLGPRHKKTSLFAQSRHYERVLTLPGPGRGHLPPPSPPGIGHLLCSEGCTYELQTFWVFQLWFQLASQQYFFFQFSSTALRKLTGNDKNQEILDIEKRFFFLFII